MVRRAWMMLAVTACGGSGTDAPGDDTGSIDDTVSDDPYAGLPEPAAPAAYSGGDCPAFVAGSNTNITSHTRRNRAFTLALPNEPQGAGVLFLWHGNGGDGASFARSMGAESIATTYDLLVISPEAGSGSTLIEWSVPPDDPTADATWFDDLLACADAQFEIDRRRVYTAGFSAGAIWSSWLAMNRSEQLAGAVIFSGGTDISVGFGPEANRYTTPATDIPVLLTQGGPTDRESGVNFSAISFSMARQLRTDGSTAILCNHTEGHTPPTGFDAWAWPFLDAHVYGLTPSPYANGSDPSGALPGDCDWE